MTFGDRKPLGPGAKSLERGSTFASRGNGLTRTGGPKRKSRPGANRPSSPNHPGDLTGHSCYFHDVLGWDGECHPQIDPCHFIAQQRIIHTYEARREPCPDLWHPALWTPGCRNGHTVLDHLVGRLPRSAYPDTLVRWADEHRFFWDEVKGWLGEKTPAEAAA